MEYPIIPSIRPNQMHGGHLSDIRFFNPRHELTTGQKQSCFESSAWIAPTKIAEYVAATYPMFRDMAEVFEKHTTYPAYLPFISFPIRSKGLSRLHLTNSFGNIWVKNNHSRNRKAWCRSCAIEDTAQFGVAIWRREHQILASDFCAKHKKRLVTQCGHCRFSAPAARYFGWPGTLCQCGGQAPEKSSFADMMLADEILLKVSIFITEFLQKSAKWACYGPEDFANAYFIKSRELGLTTPNGSLDIVSLHSCLERMSNTTKLVDKFADTFRLRSNWAEAITERGSNFLPGNAFIAASLFENVDELHAILTSSVYLPLPQPLSGRLRGRPQRFDGLTNNLLSLEKLKQKFLSILLVNPVQTRTQMSKKNHELIKTIRRLDLDWYEKYAPRRQGRNSVTKSLAPESVLAATSDDVKIADFEKIGRRKATRETVDERLAIFIRKRYETEIRSQHRPQQITKAFLLRGSELKWLPKSDTNFPLASAEIIRLSESRLQCKHRIALWMMNNSTRYSDRRSIISHARKSTGLDVKTLMNIAANAENLCSLV